ncbi:60S ribosomal protein L7-like 1 [Stylosanthes scabra]|uniref:60S ribosomal protein L7-like 1 n=1 Tax=Stylosanthes scabra TaxID=79078 RepID=A0ABU6XKG5_9FABA|nr:60S ribosomal protein L7-like 1 [Stylosanthes scabra]
MQNFQGSFYKKHFKDDEQHIQIRFERELLPAKVLYYRRLAVISAGWRLFTRRSKLQPGDVTVFELVNREDPLLDVHIYRAHEQALEPRTGGFRLSTSARKSEVQLRKSLFHSQNNAR